MDEQPVFLNHLTKMHIRITKKKQQQTIPTELPPLFGEVSANVCG
jgi:hypothetical protein